MLGLLTTLMVYGIVIGDISVENNPFCQWEYSANVHYDLCSLTLKSGGQLNYYKIQDETFKYDTNKYSEYYFNWGAPVLEMPSALCKNLQTGPCVALDTSSDTCACKNEQFLVISYPTWFYKQTYEINEQSGLFDLTDCAHLTNANDDSNTKQVYWNIWQNTIEQKKADVTNGLILVIGNGDFSKNIPYKQQIQTGNCNYFVRWNVECADESTIPTNQYMLYDARIGQYIFTTRSIYGCPIECLSYDNKLCAGNGVCRYDYNLDQPRCFCFNGYKQDIDSGCREKSETESTVKAITKTYNEEYSHVFQIEDNTEKTQKVVFDLTEFHTKKDFSIKDLTQADGANYWFIFNLEGPGKYIDPDILPDACKTSSAGLPCVDFSANGMDCDKKADESTIGYGVAFRHRINNGKEQCDLLGTEINWQLYNDKDPSKGILLTAVDGAFCEGTGRNKNASILLQCSNKPEAWTSDIPPDAATDIWELDSEECSFEGWFATGLACPNDCITQIANTENGLNQYVVCSGNGVCAYDFHTKFIRCLCYNGYKGDDCSEEIKSGSANEWWIFSKQTLEIIIGSLIFMLLVMCIIFGMCYMKMSKKIYRIDQNKLIDEENNDFKNVVNINGDVDVYSDDKSQNSNDSMSSNDVIQSPDENEQFLKK